MEKKTGTSTSNFIANTIVLFKHVIFKKNITGDGKLRKVSETRPNRLPIQLTSLNRPSAQNALFMCSSVLQHGLDFSFYSTVKRLIRFIALYSPPNESQCEYELNLILFVLRLCRSCGKRYVCDSISLFHV